ncbi:Aste57867_21874 [Aphanomyces stellatus]|uniref:Aste57867_21874 protein n=1 Tax=Aphanomyces stellatus TaxID=120398 RepID=A0A485LIP9_9STRA|nr:hypothetical protein As57867_021805 [Aphanomyces stellatus]VFT98542.1 Aste57867_21874 [Aphanomyces stellatus]
MGTAPSMRPVQTIVYAGTGICSIDGASAAQIYCDPALSNRTKPLGAWDGDTAICSVTQSQFNVIECIRMTGSWQPINNNDSINKSNNSTVEGK